MTAGPAAPDLAQRLAYLRSLGAQEVIETHASFVVLLREEVLKLKKPVRTAFVDLRTPAARRRNAEAELRLNRRLAPQVYRDVLALRWDGHAFALQPDTPGAVIDDAVDWLVRMQRLPRALMLDRRVSQGSLTRHDVEGLATVLVRFYASAVRPALAPSAYVDRLLDGLRGHAQVLALPPLRGLHGHTLAGDIDRALRHHGPLLRARVSRGQVVEGHGDLRPEHVCLLDPPVVIDALEFDRRLREVDPLEELALLSLECEQLGDRAVGPALRDACLGALRDAPAPALWWLHLARQALARARFTLAHLLEPAVRSPGLWRPRGEQYLSSAASALQRVLS